MPLAGATHECLTACSIIARRHVIAAPHVHWAYSEVVQACPLYWLSRRLVCVRLIRTLDSKKSLLG
jgi:hypothetical protein